MDFYDGNLGHSDVFQTEFWQNLAKKEVELAVELFDPDQIDLREKLAAMYQLDYISGVSEGMAFGQIKRNNNTALINTRSGKPIKLLDIRSFSPFVGGVAFVETDFGYYRLINKKGEFVSGEVVQPTTLTKETMSSGIFSGAAKVNGEVGDFFFGIDGKVKFDKKGYLHTTPFCDGKAWVQRRDGKFAIINEKGEETVVRNVKRLITYADGVAWVVKSTRGMMDAAYDQEGKELFHGNFAEVLPFHEGLAAVKDEKGQWFYLDKKGKKKAGPFVSVHHFCEGRAVVTSLDKDGKETGQYVIDSEGNAISRGYLEVRDYSECLAAAKLFQDRWIFLDKDGRECYLNVFSDVQLDFQDGVAKVGLASERESIWVNKKGRRIFDSNQ